MFSLKKPSTAELAALVGDAVAMGNLSYSEVGATSGDLPAGYRHDRWQTDLGPDKGGPFDRATAALRQWQPQRGAGLRVFPDDPVRLDTPLSWSSASAWFTPLQEGASCT